MHKAKKKILDCLDLAAEDAARLTTEPTATQLHVVPMGMINFKQMSLALKMGGGRYKTVVGIRPTGELKQEKIY